jgi:hypothetical protein
LEFERNFSKLGKLGDLMKSLGLMESVETNQAEENCMSLVRIVNFVVQTIKIVKGQYLEFSTPTPVFRAKKIYSE